MTKTKLILLATFLVVFGAGASLGVLVSRPGQHPRHPSWLADELNLTDSQREQMQKIWSETVASSFSQQGERRAALAQERDKAIAALLSEAQRAEYEKIQQDHTQKVDALAQDRRKAFDQAVSRIKQILTPQQAQKYEEIMKRQPERGMGGGPGGFRGPRRRHSAPASGPTTTDAKLAPHGGE